MEYNSLLPDFWGGCELKSDSSLEELAEILSERVFSGIKFGGKEKAIHEEIPAVFIQKPFFGMLVILEGYSGLDNWFVLSVQPYGEFNRYLSTNKIKKERVDLDFYLYHLLKHVLIDVPKVKIMEPKRSC